jgi:hypothetical protein
VRLTASRPVLTSRLVTSTVTIGRVPATVLNARRPSAGDR